MDRCFVVDNSLNFYIVPLSKRDAFSSCKSIKKLEKDFGKYKIKGCPLNYYFKRLYKIDGKD
jgi:hypothetical protein